MFLQPAQAGVPAVDFQTPAQRCPGTLAKTQAIFGHGEITKYFGVMLFPDGRLATQFDTIPVTQADTYQTMEGGIAVLINIHDVRGIVRSTEMRERPLPVFIPEALHSAEKIIMQANPAAGLPWIDFCHAFPLVLPLALHNGQFAGLFSHFHRVTAACGDRVNPPRITTIPDRLESRAIRSNRQPGRLDLIPVMPHPYASL